MELSKAVLDCMQKLRRKLRAEQHVDIRLSQPDAIPAMLAACGHSTDEETRQLGQELARLSGERPSPPPPRVISPPASSKQPAETLVRIYRGQRVLA